MIDSELPPLDLKHQGSDPTGVKKRKMYSKVSTGLHKSSHEVEANYNLSFECVKVSN